jgi:hypothetical protein
VVSRQLHSTTDKGQLTNDGGKHYVDGRYVVRHDQSVALQVASYDPAKPLVIDPVLAYSTYLGGTGEGGGGIAVDASGNAYIAGWTYSADFPTTPGVFQTTLAGGSNAFVSKLNAAGSALVYSTYLGGSSYDFGSSIAVDASGNAYVTGYAESSNFPTTPGAFQTTFGGDYDAFISKLDATGSALVYSTYLGGSGGDWGQAFCGKESSTAPSLRPGRRCDLRGPALRGGFQVRKKDAEVLRTHPPRRHCLDRAISGKVPRSWSCHSSDRVADRVPRGWIRSVRTPYSSSVSSGSRDVGSAVLRHAAASELLTL